MSRMLSTGSKPFEEFYSEDNSGSAIGNLFRSNATTITSYDLLAKSCSSTASTLKSYGKIRRLTKNCRMYDNICDYVTNSSGGRNISVQNIFRVERVGERAPFTSKYRIILWHGTSPQAIPGIIQTGFRMGSGGLFGGGIYFADRIAKSLQYVTETSQGTAFFVLAEIDPGKVYKAHHFHSNYSTAPKGFDSVKGNGQNIPDWKGNIDYGGAILPCGPTKQNTRHTQYDMPWNEYILYDPNQIIIRFVVECSL